MILMSNEKLSLDVRSGSFCIYENESLKCLSSGDIYGNAFTDDHEAMVKFAEQKFSDLSNK